MSEHDLEKLLGGFAADTLTPEEKQALYAAALQDQQLFNALADEQALKELLADPAVRRRLLASLEQKRAAGAGDSLSWLDWFRRPTGLAFAGGLSAAALALVLGVRIYQESLKQAAPSIATEDGKPATPQAVEPRAKTKENHAPAMDFEKKDTLIDKLDERARSAPPPTKKERVSDVARDSMNQRREQDEVRRHTEAPVGALSKSEEEVILSADQKLAASSTPAATVPELKQRQPPTGGRIAAIATSALSARALFYGRESGRADTGMMATEKEQAMKPLAKSAPQANRPERPLEGLSQLGRAAGTAGQLKPLGLRYSFVVRGTDGQEREMGMEAASKSTEPVFLTMEANQDAYLQVWKTVGSSTPQLLWPGKETGQVSLKMTAGRRQHITLPMESGPTTYTARLSQVPHEPTMKQEAAMYDRLSSNQLQERIAPSGTDGSQEHATYIVNQDSSATAHIIVEMLLGK
jgi:hypothetical protein